MGTTPIFAWPYPEGSDAPAGHTQMKALAEAIEPTTVMRFDTVAIRNSVLVGALAPKPGMVVYTADDKQTRQWNTNLAKTWSGWTPLPGTFVAELNREAVLAVQPSVTTLIAFDSVPYDLLGGWAATPNPSRYTCNVPGRYLLHIEASFDAGGTGYRSIYLNVNGATIRVSSVGPNPSANSQMAVTHSFTAAAGSYVEFFVRQNSAVMNTGTGVYKPSMFVTYHGMNYV